jgi:hypothetical protein
MLRRLLRRMRIRSLEQGRPVENLDAMTAARQHQNPLGGESSYPPGYVKSYDEGRPRK